MSLLGLAAANTEFAIVPPTARTVKPPFPQFRPAQKDRNHRGLTVVEFDTMGRRRAAHDYIPLAAHLTPTCLKPFGVFTTQNDRQACSRMVVKRPTVIRTRKAMQINVEEWMVTAQLPAIQVRRAIRIPDHSRGRVVLDILQDTPPNPIEQYPRNLHFSSLSWP